MIDTLERVILPTGQEFTQWEVNAALQGAAGQLLRAVLHEGPKRIVVGFDAYAWMQNTRSEGTSRHITVLAHFTDYLKGLGIELAHREPRRVVYEERVSIPVPSVRRDRAMVAINVAHGFEDGACNKYSDAGELMQRADAPGLEDAHFTLTRGAVTSAVVRVWSDGSQDLVWEKDS